MDPALSEFIWSVALRLPVLLVTLGGIVWALVNMKKAPNAALLAAMACGLLLIFSFIFPAMLTWLPGAMAREAPGDPMDRFRWTVRAIIGSWNVCTAFCVGALIVAVFAGRSASRAPEARDGKMRWDDADEPPADDRFKSM